MEYYLQKTYYKTASLISNSCKAIALLAGQTAEVSMLAYDYGRNLVSCFFCCGGRFQSACNSLPWSFQGLAYQLIDDVLDFIGTSASLGKGSLSDIRHVIFLVLHTLLLYIWYDCPSYMHLSLILHHVKKLAIAGWHIYYRGVFSVSV